MHVVQETATIKIEVYEPGEDLTDEAALKCADAWLRENRKNNHWDHYDIERKNYNRVIVHFGGL